MYFKIIERFGPQDKEKWTSYLDWRGLELNSLDSVDSHLRPDLFIPASDDDWENCVNENFKTSLITNLEYAESIFDGFNNAVLVGVETKITHNYIPEENLLGFDIIDEQCGISLLTNWGTDEEDIMNPHIQENGLVKNIDQAISIKEKLRGNFSDDSHAGLCEVWAIYNIPLNKSLQRKK